MAQKKMIVDKIENACLYGSISAWIARALETLDSKEISGIAEEKHIKST
jgi:hypothetical protein